MKKENTKKENTKKENEDWIQKKWRPMMAVMYMSVCAFDFIVFPIMFTIVQFWETQAANDAFRQWQPITLLGGGLFHLAMVAVLGVSAWSRGQEKIAGAATNNQMMSMPSTPMSYNQPQQMNTNYNNSSMYNQPSYQQSYVQESTYTSVAPVTTGYRGKKAPMQPDDPII
jgi:hypothetical protein